MQPIEAEVVMRLPMFAAIAALLTACAGAAPDDAQTAQRASPLAAPTSSAGKPIPFGPEGVATIGSPVRPAPQCFAKAHPPITYVPMDGPMQPLSQTEETETRVGDTLDLPCGPIENPIDSAPSP